MTFQKRIDVVELLNDILFEETKLRTSIGIQLIEIGMYWLKESAGEEFLRSYLLATLPEETVQSYRFN